MLTWFLSVPNREGERKASTEKIYIFLSLSLFFIIFIIFYFFVLIADAVWANLSKEEGFWVEIALYFLFF